MTYAKFEVISRKSLHKWRARKYIERLKVFCADRCLAPHRSVRRAGLHPALRTIGFEHRISVVLAISDEEKTVRIINFHYAGRSWDEATRIKN